MNAATFAQHSLVVQVPRLVTTEPARVATDRPSIDAIADYWLRRERQAEADAASELQTEGRVFPSRPNRHDD